MKFKTNNQIFNAKPLILVLVFLLALAQGSAFANPAQDEKISLGEFVSMMAKHHPDSPYVPDNFSQLSAEKGFYQMAGKLEAKGFKVLKGRLMDQPVQPMDFIRLTYAFSGQPAGKNLFDQKLYLKKAGIIESADVGMTTGLEGEVFQKHQDSQMKNKAKLAAAVYMDDHFETDLESRATFTFDDKSTMTMGEDSVVKISKHIYDPDKDLRQTVIELTEGIVRFAVTKGKAEGSEFKVITPTATAGVRGTEFVVIVDRTGKTTFLVTEGQIETRPRLSDGRVGKLHLVSAGENQSVSNTGKATKVRKVTPGLLRSTLAKTMRPNQNFVPPGLAKKMALTKINLMGFANKGQAIKAMKPQGSPENPGLKNKVLNKATKTALLDVKKLDKKFNNVQQDNSTKRAPEELGKSNAKANAKANAKSNAKANAKNNAKSNAKNNAKNNARQVVKEKGKGKGKV